MIFKKMNMYRIKVIVIILLGCMGCMTPSSAQTDPDAASKAINYVIRTIRPAKGAEPLAEELCKKFKNHPEVIVAIGEAYYQTADSTTGKKYFRRAINENPKYVPAYIAAGAWAEDRYNAYDEAMDWYDKAIKANPKDSAGYIRYAKVLTKLRKPEEAAEKIMEITKYVPDFPVNLQISRIYSNLGQISKALEYYAKEDLNNMDTADLIDYATDCFLKKNYEEGLKVTTFGMNKYPRNAQLNRVALYCSVDSKNFKQAVEYAERLFTATDNHNASWQDNYYTAVAYQGANKYNQAIEWFWKCTKLDSIGAKERKDSYRNIAKIYKELGDYDKAAETFETLYQAEKAEGKVSVSDINLHARLFMEQSTEVNGTEVFECLRKANAIYMRMVDEAPTYAGLAYYSIMLNCQRMDPKFEQALAISPAEKVIEYLSAKEEKNSSDIQRLVDANWTLCYYYAITKPVNKSLVKKYGQEMQRLKPDDERPNRIFNALNIK